MAKSLNSDRLDHKRLQSLKLKLKNKVKVLLIL